MIGAPFQPFVQNPYGGLFGPSMTQAGMIMAPQTQGGLVPPENNLPRALNFYADYSGCGFWRLIWPEHLLNSLQKLAITGGCVMALDPRFYVNVKCVRIQRQATANQFEFVKFLKQLSQELGFHMVYEVDDIIFHEDIPDYNKFKEAFVSPEIRNVSQQIMNMCDEVTVTCPFMRDYYTQKTGHPNVTVIPNCPPRWWLGNFYNEKDVAKNYDKHKKRPRILYPGSGAHFDVDRRVKGNDDFAHVNEMVIKTRDKFKWVFIAAYPYDVQPYIQSGEMEFHNWRGLYEYGRFISSLEVNAFVAPLQDNTFNKAKSDLKYLEAACFGLPAICQDLVTYQNAPYRFKTGEEMIAQLEKVLRDKDTYMKASRKARAFAETRFLENPENIGMYEELYKFKKGSTNEQGEPNRKLLK